MAESPTLSRRPMRVALLGAGTIGRLVLSHALNGGLPSIELAGILARPGSARAQAAAAAFGIPVYADRAALLASKVDAVLEAASHEAGPDHAAALGEAGESLIIRPAGASADEPLREAAEAAARRSG